MQFNSAVFREFPGGFQIYGAWDPRLREKKGGGRCQKVIPSSRNDFFLQGSSFTFFLEHNCRQLFACAQKNRVLKYLVFLSHVSPKDNTSWSEKETKGQFPESLGLLWRALANICSLSILWMLPLWKCKTWRYQQMSPRLKGHFYLAILLVPFWFLFKPHSEDFHIALDLLYFWV